MAWRRGMILALLLTGVFVSYRNTIRNRNYAFISRRKTVEILTDEKGMIKNMGTESDPLYAIICEDLKVTLFPFSLPSEFQTHGKRIVFSGTIKEMHLAENDHRAYVEISKINSYPEWK